MAVRPGLAALNLRLIHLRFSAALLWGPFPITVGLKLEYNHNANRFSAAYQGGAAFLFQESAMKLCARHSLRDAVDHAAAACYIISRKVLLEGWNAQSADS